MASFVVLLRAVNVGGTTLSMARWKEVLHGAGLSARTLGAAGSAVVDAPDRTTSARLEAMVESGLAREAGLVTDAFARGPEEWAGIVRANPFPAAAQEDPAHLVVTTLKDQPKPAAWPALERAIQGRERVAPGIRCAYVVYPDGIGRSKLTPAVIERHLGFRGTSRNWNTVLALRDLVAQPDPTRRT